MRQPRDAYTTANGLWSFLAMAGAQNLIDQVYQALGGQHWGVFNWILDGLRTAVLDIARTLVDWTFPGAPGSIDYLTAAPEALADAVGNIATTLVMMRDQRRWIEFTFIPEVQQVDWARMADYYQANRNLAYQLYYQAVNYTTASVNSIDTYVNAQVNYLTRQMNADLNESLNFTSQVYQLLSNALNLAVITANNRMDLLNNRMTQYVNSVRDALNGSISNLRIATVAAIAALGAFLTGVYIPGAFAAFKVEQTAEIAAGMDVGYPLAAASIDKTALQLAPTLPLVSARVLDVPPEAIPGIGGMAEALTAAAAFEAAVSSNACAPLWTKLHEFADDTAELDGIAGTVLLGALVTAMVTAPHDTAAVIADTIAGPLNDIGVEALGLIGLG